MKIKDLIQALSRLDPEAPVHLAYSAGDYWHSTLAAEVVAVEVRQAHHSNYHQGLKLVKAEEDAEGEEILEVVVLR